MVINDLVSVIIPVFNEEKSLVYLIRELLPVLNKLTFKTEIICVNDGSTDKSGPVLDQLASKNKKLKIIHFTRNFGQTAAIAAGINLAQGKIIILMDADLQNDPTDIPRLLDKLWQGYDIVSGWRKPRKDPVSRVFASIVANKIISLTTGVKLHDIGCTLKVYRKEVFSNFSLYGEMHRFLPSLAAPYGAKITEIKVKHRQRKYGKSKYDFKRVLKILLDLLTVKFFGSFSTKPIYVFGGMGFVLLSLGLLSAGFVIIRRIFFGGEWISPMIFVAVILLTVSVQFVLMGLLAEIMIRTYFESSHRSIYKIEKKVNF